MTAAYYNITDQTENDTFDIFNINLFDSLGVAMDLTTVSSVRLQWRRSSEKGKLMETFTIGAGLTWIDQSLGQLRQPSFAIDWGYGTYHYDVQFTYASGEVKTYLKGTVKIVKEVTQG